MTEGANILRTKLKENPIFALLIFTPASISTFTSLASPSIPIMSLFCLALFQFKKYQFRQYRLWMLCSVLIWVVIFNHRAESASYIIAYVGICLWFVTSPINRFTILLMGFSFILVTLSPTDLFPRIWREQLVQKYTLKAVPVMIVWIALLVQMIRPIDHSIQEIDGELNKLK